MKSTPLSSLAATLTLYLISAPSPARSQDENLSGNRLAAFVAAVSEYPGNSAMYESITNAGRITKSLSALDFKVTSLFNFTKPEFEEAFQNWCNETGDAEVAVVYLCGHGGNQDGENYLFPIGTDASALSQLPEQCIGLRALLETLTQGQESGKRLNLVAVDGSRENPFLSRAFGFEELSVNSSAYYSLPYLPRDTIVIRPTGSGELIDRKDTSLLSETLSDYLFADNTELRRGLETVRSLIREKSGGYLDPSLAIEFDGSLTFRKKVNGTQTVLSFPGKESDQEARFGQLRKEAQEAVTAANFESAIKTLLQIHREVPTKRDIAISDLKSILTSSSMEDPFVGKLLMESTEFDFSILASKTGGPDGPGLDLGEARKVFWSSGNWFPELWDKALIWAEYDAKQGIPEAMRVCGELCLKKGNEGKEGTAAEWFKKAADWFKKGADRGDVKSIVWLGQLHLLGRGVPQSFEIAEKHFSDVRKMGDPRGAAGLGALELSKLKKENPSTLGNADFTATIKYFREAHEGKFFKNSYLLGTLLWMKSEDAKLDKKEAAKIRKEAIEILLTGVEKGVQSNCMWRIIKLIESKNLEGEEDLLALVPKDKQSELLKQAADLGFPEAVKDAQVKGMDYLDAARPLCEKWNLNYRLWKMDQKMANTLLD